MKSNNIVRIFFPLPFYLPVEEGNQIVCHYEDFASFKFVCNKFKNDSIIAKSEFEECCTQITIDFLFEKEFEIKEAELLREAVKNSIIYLNNFLDSFRLVNDFNFIRNFTITDLPPVIEIELNEEKRLYITSPTSIIAEKTPINNEQLAKTQSRLSTWDNYNYFEVVDKFLSKSIHHLYTEEFLFAIVEMQTSFESYIRLCHNLILKKNGANESTIQTASSYPFKNTIVDHIGRALNANLDFSANPIIKEWFENLYSLRNKIVHSGLSYISGNEAYDAYDAMEKAIIYINDLMVENGFMEENGKIEISQLVKNSEANVDFDRVMEKLKEKKLID